jgi:transcription antitermination protein NusB
MGNRRKSRELVLQMLFQADMGKQTRDHVRKTFWSERQDVEEDVRGFADDLFGIATNDDSSAKIDKLIEENAAHWRLERMAAVDRNLIRAAVAEMVGYPQTPRPIIINEALEIARKYSNPESVNFINGVLDGVGKALTKS